MSSSPGNVVKSAPPRIEPQRGELRPLQEAQAGQWVKVLIAGKPKSAGKTTFALTAPGKKLHLAYDLGYPPRGIPGVDEALVWSVQYEPGMQGVQIATDRWSRPSNVGAQIISDIEAIRNAFVKKQEWIEFAGGVRCPLPDTIIMDGMTEMPAIILDWIMSVNKKADPDEFENNFAVWGKRLNTIRQLLHMILPLPCHVAMIAWEAPEMVNLKPTGKILPDIGGQLDNKVPGKAEAAVRCFARFQDGKVRYFAQIKPDAVRDWVGVRGRYDSVSEIDVTIDPGKPGVGAWEKVFGKAGMTVRPEPLREGETNITIE